MTDDFFVARPVEKNPSRARRWVIGLVVAIVLIVLGVIALFAGDSIARAIAEDVVKSQVEQRLPENVEADVDVSIEGDWVIAQLLSGRLENVVMTDEDAVLDGVPVGIHIDATDVPTDVKQTVGHIDATATLDAAALNSFLTLPAGDPELSLGDGTLAYENSSAFLGIQFSYLLSVTPQAAGTSLILTPESAELTTDFGSVDVAPVIERLVGDAPVTVCVAEYLPEGAQLTALAVTPEAADLTISMSDVELSGALLESRGSCG
jgi:hypothetical protein